MNARKPITVRLPVEDNFLSRWRLSTPLIELLVVNMRERPPGLRWWWAVRYRGGELIQDGRSPTVEAAKFRAKVEALKYLKVAYRRSVRLLKILEESP